MQLPSPSLSYLHFISLGIQDSAHTEITVKTGILLDRNTPASPPVGLLCSQPKQPKSSPPHVSVSIYYCAEESHRGNLFFFQKSLVPIMCQALEMK